MQNKDNNSAWGIDISHYTTVTDWNAVKNAGVKFIYTKATQGTSYVDPMMDSFIKGSKSVGIPIGLYHFAQPSNNPVDEAKHFLDILGRYTLELIPVLDLEVSANGVDLVQWTRKFIETMNRPIIFYTGNWFIDQYNISGLQDLLLWTAYYKDTPPYDCGKWTKWLMWQYSESGKLAGIQGDVDLNWCADLNAIMVKKEQDYMMKAEDANKLIKLLQAVYGITPSPEFGRLADELRLASGQKPQN